MPSKLVTVLIPKQKKTNAQYGQGDRENICVVDTAGYQDSDGSDRENLLEMVNSIKEIPGIQAVLLILNFQQPRLALYIRTIIKLLCNIFSDSNFWGHVALVWTKFYYYLPPKIKNKKDEYTQEMTQEILKLVRETCGDLTISTLPTFLVDCNFKRKDPFSLSEIDRLIEWASNLEPLDMEMVKEADPEIKEFIEENEVREKKDVVGNVEHITKEYYKRYKQIHYSGDISYSNWEKVGEDKYDNVLPPKLLERKVEKKDREIVNINAITEMREGRRRYLGIAGPRPRWEVHVGNEIVTTTECYETVYEIYNDGTVKTSVPKKISSKQNVRRERF